MDTSLNDYIVNASAFQAIPIANGEAEIFNSTKIGPIKTSAGDYTSDPTVADLTYLNPLPMIQGAVVAITPTGQGITFKRYWLINGVWVLMNGTGKAVAAAAVLGAIVPFGGAAVKLTYSVGATPPSAVAIHLRLRRVLAYQPSDATV